jgi:hypothetical protein
MAHPNPAHHRFHAIETYRSRPRATRRVAHLNAAGYRAYMVIVRRLVVVHISEGKRADLAQLPKPGGAR